VPVASGPELQAETNSPIESKPVATFHRRITSPRLGT
jgi:hypothetical protein